MKKIFLFFICIFCFFGNSEKIFSKSPIFSALESGDFIPLEQITLKQYVKIPEIWENDSSLTRFVSPHSPLSRRDYRPEKLVSISWEYINEAGRTSNINAQAKEAVEKISEHFFRDFGEPLIAISGFRSAEYQQRLWDLGRCDDGAFCAKPGFSEHQLGLAIDFFDATSETEYINNPRYKKFYEWIKIHGHHYGWTQSYQHGVKVDGYEVEPWHWRYIGIPEAKFLKKIDMSYSKFLQLSKFLSKIS